MKKLMFFRPLYSLGGTEIAMLNLVKKLEGYELYIGYTDETSDKHLLDRFAEYAEVINLNDVQTRCQNSGTGQISTQKVMMNEMPKVFELIGISMSSQQGRSILFLLSVT